MQRLFWSWGFYATVVVPLSEVFTPRDCSLREIFTPRRDGRRSPWQSHDVRVDPPAMSFVRSTYFSGSISAALCLVMCLRQGGTVAAHHFVCPLDVFHQQHFCCSINEPVQQRSSTQHQNSTSGRIGGGVFFERKRRKKSHRMVRPKRVFKKLQECQPVRMVRPKRVFTELQK